MTRAIVDQKFHALLSQCRGGSVAASRPVLNSSGVLIVAPLQARRSMPSHTPASAANSPTNPADCGITHADTSASLKTQPAACAYSSNNAVGLMKRGERHQRCSLGRCCESQRKGKSKSRDARPTHVSFSLNEDFFHLTSFVGEPPPSTNRRCYRVPSCRSLATFLHHRGEKTEEVT
jgi:hypothetical protein